MKALLPNHFGRKWSVLGVAGALALALSFLSFSAPLCPQESQTHDLTVHEWGTFTGIADDQGKAIKWTAYNGLGSDDLPDFVELISNVNFKGGLRGTIRMETPVIYFYSPTEVSVSVKVAFSQGLITEWYPHAASVQPAKLPFPVNLEQMTAGGSVMWKNVTVSPNLRTEFPHEQAASRYYAARETSAATLAVDAPSGTQHEKFLFYRGVSAAPLPLTALSGKGSWQKAEDDLLVKSLSGEEIPALIYFERRGNRIGYSIGGGGTEVRLDPPRLDGDLESLTGDLTRILIDQGLYPEEAQAMMATWRDSWFEEGSRLIYIVPRGFVDKLLPLTIDPAPSQLVRVFVGRLEIVSPATIREVAVAVKLDKPEYLNKYGRFRDAILQIVGATFNAGCGSGCGK